MLVLAMFSLHTKTEMPAITYSKDMNEDQQFKSKGDLGWLGSTKVIGSVMFVSRDVPDIRFRLADIRPFLAIRFRPKYCLSPDSATG